MTPDTRNHLKGFVAANPAAADAAALSPEDWRAIAQGEILARRARSILPLIDDQTLAGIADGSIDMAAQLAALSRQVRGLAADT